MKPITLADIHPERVDDYRWRLPRTGPMRVDGLVYADESVDITNLVIERFNAAAGSGGD